MAPTKLIYAFGALLGLLVGDARAGEHRRQPDADGLFLDFGAGIGLLGGSSNTTNGGAAFGGGGVLHSLSFDPATLIEAEIGKRWNRRLETALSFQHMQSQVHWLTDFPAIASTDVPFSGQAVSNQLMLNLAYHQPMTEAVTLTLGAGIGAGLNTIFDTQEGLPVYGQLGSRTVPGLAAQASIAADFALSEKATFRLTSSLTYFGHFETADYRFVNWQAAPEAITPYSFDAWGGSVSASLTLKF